MYYITNGKICWHIENQIGEWFENGAFRFAYDGWSLLQTGNLMITRGWAVGVCGEITPKTKKAEKRAKKAQEKLIGLQAKAAPKKAKKSHHKSS